MWRGEERQNYQLLDLAMDIEVYLESDDPDESGNFASRLVKFLKGEPRKDKQGNKFRTPTILGDKRIEAIITFLTTPESKGYFCSREQILATPKTQAPFFFQEELNKLGPKDKAKQLFSENSLYVAMPGIRNPRFSFLHIYQELSRGSHLVDIETREKFPSTDQTLNSSISEPADLMSGWLVTTALGGMMMFTYDSNLDSHIIYSLAAVDTPFSCRPPASLALLGYEAPLLLPHIVNSLEILASDLTSNILVFEKFNP